LFSSGQRKKTVLRGTPEPTTGKTVKRGNDQGFSNQRKNGVDSKSWGKKKKGHWESRAMPASPIGVKEQGKTPSRGGKTPLEKKPSGPEKRNI